MKAINKRKIMFSIVVSSIISLMNLNSVTAYTNTGSLHPSVVKLESINIMPNIEYIMEDTPKTYTINSNVLSNNTDVNLIFNCTFVKLSTNNAYNGIFLSDEINLASENINASNIHLIILPKCYLEKSQLVIPNSDEPFLCEISFEMDGEIITGSKMLSQTEVSAISSYTPIIENNGEEYLSAISKIKKNKIQYSSVEIDTNLFNDKFWTAYQENNSSLHSLSSIGNSVRSIVNDDSWFTTTGKAIKKISDSQRICVKNSGNIGSAIYTDVLIWQYALTQPTQTSTASIKLQMLYNTTIIYNNGNWTDYGANASSLTLRGSTVGIKTTGTCNNDFYYQVDQSGAYNTGSDDSSPVQDVLKKCFFKAVPYGNYISTGVDLISSFVKSKTGSYNFGFGTITYDDIPSVHFNQNGGYVRSALLNAGNYNIYKDTHYQEQKVYIVKRPSECLKTCTYQSHFEVLGFYNSGFTTLYNSSISYQRSYT